MCDDGAQCWQMVCVFVCVCVLLLLLLLLLMLLLSRKAPHRAIFVVCGLTRQLTLRKPLCCALRARAFSVMRVCMSVCVCVFV